MVRKGYKEFTPTVNPTYRVRRFANKHGLENAHVFSEWYVKRFPTQTHNEDYMGIWVERFKSGNPTRAMDAESVKDYFIVIGKQIGISKEKIKKLF